MNESKHFCPHIVNNIDFILSTLSISLTVKTCTTVKWLFTLVPTRFLCSNNMRWFEIHGCVIYHSKVLSFLPYTRGGGGGTRF